jgi:large subunit ribosomal protein L21
MEFKGKQYKAEKGATLKVDLVDAEPGAKLDIDSVLLVSDAEGASVSVGSPYVKGAKVSATVDSHIKAVRRKLGSDLIRTVHGVGYAFEPVDDAE